MSDRLCGWCPRSAAQAAAITSCRQHPQCTRAVREKRAVLFPPSPTALLGLTDREVRVELGLARGAVDQGIPDSHPRLRAAERENRRRHGPDGGGCS